MYSTPVDLSFSYLRSAVEASLDIKKDQIDLNNDQSLIYKKKSEEKILGTPIGATFGCQHERVKEKSRFGNYKLKKKVNTLSKTEPPPPHPKT
jgi:hypothetical protein